MARDVEVDVKVHDKTKPGLDAVERNFRRSGRNIEQEYERFGNRAGDRILGAIGSVAPKVAKGLAESVGTGAKIGAPVLISTLTGAAAVAAPVVAGLLGSAVAIGGVGAGIIGGATLAARDGRVRAAGIQLGNNLLLGLQDRAGSFIDPMLDSIDLLQDKFMESGDTIENIFKNSSRFVLPLTDALGDAGQSLLEGIDVAVENAGPVIDALAKGLRETGEQLKEFFGDVTRNAEGNAAILGATFDGLNSILDATGFVLGEVVGWFEAINRVIPLSVLASSNLLTILEEISDTQVWTILTSGVLQWADALGLAEDAGRRSSGGSFGTAKAFQSVGLEAEEAEKSTKAYEKALRENEQAARDAANAQRSLFDDLTRVGQAEDDLKKAVRDNGKTLDAHTEKGRNNRQALSNMASAYNTVRDNMSKANKPAAEINSTLNTQRARLIEAGKQMGLTGSKARTLADQLLGIKPRSVDVTVKTGKALTNAQAVKREISEIKGKTVTVTVNVNASRLAAVENRLGRLERAGYFAEGGSFGLTAPGQTSRTGGPVEVTSNVSVSLDGKPFRDVAVRAVQTNLERDRFRQKVGRRDS